jgi:hypothetical protein
LIAIVLGIVVYFLKLYPKSSRTPPDIQAINPGSFLIVESISEWHEGQVIRVASIPTGITAVTITGWPEAARKQKL